MLRIKTLKDIVRVVYIYSKEAKIAFWVTLVSIVLFAFAFPPRYHSEARLLIKPGRETSALPIEVSDRATYVSPSTQHDPILDEELQLTGRTVVSKVAEYYFENVIETTPKGAWKRFKHYLKQRLSEFLETLNDSLVVIGLSEKQSKVDTLVNKLEKKFSVSHSSGSSVIQLEFVWNDPAVAQKVLDKWISTYMEERAQNLGRKSLYDFYLRESNRIAKQISDNKLKISEYLASIDGIGSKERLQVLTDKIDKLSNELTDEKSELSGLSSGLKTVSENMKALPNEIVKEREISLNPARMDMLVKLNDLELQRLDKLKIFKPDSPPIREIDSNIHALKEKISSENINLQSSQNLAPNELVTNLKKNTLDRTTRISELTALIKSSNDLLTALKAERANLMQVEPELSRLERELSVNEKSYALYIENLEKARIDQELDNNRISNISVIEPASYVPVRTFPRSSLLILLSIPFGLVVSILIIYLLYLIDQRIHTGDNIEKNLGVPVWSSIVDLDSHEANKSEFKASIYRIYSMLPKEKIVSTGLNIGLTSATSGEGVSFLCKYLTDIFNEVGINTRSKTSSNKLASAGEVVFIEASNILHSENALLQLKDADLTLLIVKAHTSKVITLETTLNLLQTAFINTSGIIINKRRYELPKKVFEVIS